MRELVWGRLALQWKLLGSFGLVLLLAGGAAAVGLYRLDTALGGYHALLDGSVAAAKQADDVNTAFVSRHKVLKDIYLFNTDRPRSSPSRRRLPTGTSRSARAWRRCAPIRCCSTRTAT